MQIRLVIPQVPESYNRIKDWHWGKKKEYNEGWYDEIVMAKLLYPSGVRDLPWKKAKILFYIYFKDKRKRDKINFATGLKPALDGLMQVGIIADDNWDDIEDQYYKRYDKKKPRTVIVIKGVKK